MLNILFSILLICTFFTFNSYSSSPSILQSTDYLHFPNSLNGRDFFVIKNQHSSYQQVFSENQNCKDQIAKVICLVEPTKEGETPEQRKCLEGSKSYAIFFENLYDHYPPVLQKMFCSLKYIFIEKEFVGTAYAGTIKDKDGKNNGAMIGIRKSVLDEGLNLTTWATWKEQLSFGGVKNSYKLTPELPYITTQSEGSASDFLYFVITHEFGHIIDFTNELNAFGKCKEPKNDNDPECEMHKSSWGALSWITNKLPKNDFPMRKLFCFYWCDKHIKLEDIPIAFIDLWQTDFISTYATTQPWDDFADSLAYFTMHKNLNMEYKIDTKQGEIYNVMEKLRSEKFASKYDFLEKLIQRKDLIYP